MNNCVLCKIEMMFFAVLFNPFPRRGMTEIDEEKDETNETKRRIVEKELHRRPNLMVHITCDAVQNCIMHFRTSRIILLPRLLNVNSFFIVIVCAPLLEYTRRT